MFDFWETMLPGNNSDLDWDLRTVTKVGFELAKESPSIAGWTWFKSPFQNVAVLTPFGASGNSAHYGAKVQNRFLETRPKNGPRGLYARLCGPFHTAHYRETPI